MHDRCDVLIVGAGPVGLALACELGLQGVDTLIVERAAEYGADPLPRINLVNVRSMEFCRRWGIEDEVRHGGFPPDFPMDVTFATSLAGHVIRRVPYPSMAAQGTHPASPTHRQRIPQHLLDPILRRRAQRFESVRAAFRTEVVDHVDDGDAVRVTLRDVDGGETRVVQARYLAACDGARSSVREHAGIPLDGPPPISYSFGVYFEAPHLHREIVVGKSIMSVLVDRAGPWAILVAVDGYKIWRLGVWGSDDPSERSRFDPHAAMTRAMGGRRFDYKLKGVFPWARRAVVAERYSHGRVFLCGDSAHQLSPTGGFGMNTGFGDALDLGWKLAATLAGWGGPHLLASYDAERRPIGVRNVAEATANFENLKQLPTFEWIEDTGPEADAKRAALGEKFYAQTRAEWESWGVQLGYRYDDSPIVVPDGTRAPPDDPMVYVPTARPGARLPHAWLAPGRSTLDACSRGFVLFDLGQARDAERAAQAARRRGLPLKIERCDLPQVARALERKLVLARPDGHIAWRGDACNDERVLDAVLDRVCGA